MKKKILILAGRYLPGHKDGGPLRTIINITEALGDEFDFYIACLDRDHDDTEPYPNIIRNKWNRVGKALVWYVTPGGFSFELLLKIAKGIDKIYLCSFYDDYGYKTLLLQKAGKIKCPIYIASMGVFSVGALKQKRLKKMIFISGCKALGLFRNITWSVTSEIEAEDVKRVIGSKIRYIVAEDLPRVTVPGVGPKESLFSVAFLSRISPKKNLVDAIRIMQHVKTETNFVIYGPNEDKEYWKRCQDELRKLPNHIHWHYQGDIPSDQVQEKLSRHDVFLFPTLGENYAHVIFEALSVGCIPIISDQTPWQIIADRHAGYILSLGDLSCFSVCVDQIANMSEVDKDGMRKQCVQIAIDKVESNKRETGYRVIFG